VVQVSPPVAFEVYGIALLILGLHCPQAIMYNYTIAYTSYTAMVQLLHVGVQWWFSYLRVTTCTSPLSCVETLHLALNMYCLIQPTITEVPQCLRG